MATRFIVLAIDPLFFFEMNDTEIIALEPPIEIMEREEQNILMHDAEELNGRLAMIGVMAALGAYATTGQIIPGIF